MTVFGRYAKYYDLLYRDKNYQLESQYVLELIREVNPHVHSVLDIGSGTGLHAIEFAMNGLEVQGVDISEEMIVIAKENCEILDSEICKRLEFSLGDARTLNLPTQFDAVVALFHVLGYQTSNDALNNSIKTVRKHCKDNSGLFVFDFWYGPAVLTEGMSIRIKRIEDSQFRITRIAEPTMRYELNCANVKYHILVQNKSTCCVEEIEETHIMRYLFLPEIKDMLERNRFSILSVYEWATRTPPKEDSWSVCVIAQAN